MYVSFKLYSEAQKQLRKHKKLRCKIPEWEKQGLLSDCQTELTYHPSKCFLQAVLSLPNISPSSRQSKKLSQAEINQMPKQVVEYLVSLCRENQITLSAEDHGKEMDCGRKEEGDTYWYGMRNEDIVRVCSNGTRIAFEILDKLEKNREHFKDDPELKQYVSGQIQQKLGVGFEPCTKEFMSAWHETVNPLGIWGGYSESLGHSNEEMMFDCSAGNHGLELIKARSLDCRMVFTDWKGKLLDDPWQVWQGRD